VRDLAGEHLGRALVVAVLDTEQHEETMADRSDRALADRDARLVDPLHQRLHRVTAVRARCPARPDGGSGLKSTAHAIRRNRAANRCITQPRRALPA
jgi:hypothetical protein